MNAFSTPKRLFLALEGTDGAGKTRIRKHLFQTAWCRGTEIFATIPFSWLDPGATRTIVSAKYHQAPCEPSELISAYVRDKEIHTERLVRPQLRYRHVLADRYIASDMAYLKILWDLSPEEILEAYVASTVAWPDLTIFVDTPPEIAFERSLKRGQGDWNRWDQLPEKARLYRTFHDIFESPSFLSCCKTAVIDNSGSFDDTLAQVQKHIIPLIAP
jgi:dTMP kinase